MKISVCWSEEYNVGAKSLSAGTSLQVWKQERVTVAKSRDYGGWRNNSLNFATLAWHESTFFSDKFGRFSSNRLWTALINWHNIHHCLLFCFESNWCACIPKNCYLDFIGWLAIVSTVACSLVCCGEFLFRLWLWNGARTCMNCEWATPNSPSNLHDYVCDQLTPSQPCDMRTISGTFSFRLANTISWIFLDFSIASCLVILIEHQERSALLVLGRNSVKQLFTIEIDSEESP